MPAVSLVAALRVLRSLAHYPPRSSSLAAWDVATTTRHRSG
jgi:hypothetical protein